MLLTGPGENSGVTSESLLAQYFALANSIHHISVGVALQPWPIRTLRKWISVHNLLVNWMAFLLRKRTPGFGFFFFFCIAHHRCFAFCLALCNEISTVRCSNSNFFHLILTLFPPRSSKITMHGTTRRRAPTMKGIAFGTGSTQTTTWIWLTTDRLSLWAIRQRLPYWKRSVRIFTTICLVRIDSIFSSWVLGCSQVLFFIYDLRFSIWFLSGKAEDAEFCCSPDQVDDMYTNFALISGFMGRCPSCVKNLRNIFCFMTCDPHHSRYAHPNQTDIIDGEKIILKLDYYVKEEFAQNLFDSCAEVKNPSSNSLAISTLCGGWGELCNADRWIFLFQSKCYLMYVKLNMVAGRRGEHQVNNCLFIHSCRLLNAMGAGPEQHGFSPFDIYFTPVYNDQKSPLGFEPFDTPTVACSESATVSISGPFFFSDESIKFLLINACCWLVVEYQRAVLLCRLQCHLSQTETMASTSGTLERWNHGRSELCHAADMVDGFCSGRSDDAVDLGRLP